LKVNKPEGFLELLKLTKKSLRKKGEAETFGLFLKYQEISQ
jgi:hypothetical protein